MLAIGICIYLFILQNQYIEWGLYFITKSIVLVMYTHSNEVCTLMCIRCFLTVIYIYNDGFFFSTYIFSRLYMSIVSFTFYNFIIVRQQQALGLHDPPLNCLSIYKHTAIYFIEFLGSLFSGNPFSPSGFIAKYCFSRSKLSVVNPINYNHNLTEF